MGARILIQSGVGSGTVHWIQRNVVRIGSDPGMDLILPSKMLATHLLTLEFREGVYWVHNRGDLPLHLGGRAIPPKGSDRWFDTDLLELPGETRLAIEFDEDPSPTSKPLGPHSPTQHVTKTAAGTVSPPPGSSETASVPISISATTATRLPSSATKSSSSMWGQIGVIFLCIGACGFLLVRDRQTKQNGIRENLPSFGQLIQQARQPGYEDDNLLQHLQFAELAMIRGHKHAARQRYANVRAKLLVRQSDQVDLPDTFDQNLQRDLFRWVEYRLSQL